VGIPDTLGSDEVLIKMVAAPITEFDTNLIAGFGTQYAGTVLPATGGMEGLGIVVGVGSGVTDFKEGTYVVPTVAGVGERPPACRSHSGCRANASRPGPPQRPAAPRPPLASAGTWSTHTVAAAEHLVDVAAPPSGVEFGAEMMAAGVGTPALASALVQLGAVTDGDVIVQTAAHSPVGQIVAQIAAERGAAVVNIVPDHPSFDDLAQHLSALNPAGITVSETTARSPAFAKLLADMPAAALVLDGQGGSACIAAARTLRPGGLLVSYANASRKPFAVPTSLLLGQGIVVRGFNLALWAMRADLIARRGLARACAESSANGKYAQLLQTEPFADWEHALKAAASPNSTRRVVLRFD